MNLYHLEISTDCSVHFTAYPHEFDEAWRDNYDQLQDDFFSLREWQVTLIRQIVDLHKMAEIGILTDEFRHLGVIAPRGSSWYNFDPLG